MNALKRKDGAISIMIVVTILIGVVILSGFVDILKRSYVMNEVGYIMDVASITALRSGVDEQKLRAEEFEVDKSIVSRHYRELVDEALLDYGHLKSHKHYRTEIEAFDESWGIGGTGKAHKQVLIDSTIVLVVASNKLFDTVPGLAKRYYNSRSNDDVEVNFGGVTDDGFVELSVRSVSRVVYR